MNSLLTLFLQIPAVIFATTIHEFSRAAVSTAFGDRKPKNDGRLTLNPAKHFEPIGFLLAWITGFGWGKPVETSPMFYKNKKSATLVTAVMPSIINIVFAIIFAMLFSFVGKNNLVIYILLYDLVRFNVSLAVYNIVPVTPMDGIKVLSVLLPANKYYSYIQYEKIIQMVFLLVLFMGYTDAIFNPIISFVMSLLIR